MNEFQIHALGLHLAVNGLALSRRAAQSHELREAARERKREQRARRRTPRGLRGGKDAYTTAI